MKSYTLNILWTKEGDGQPHQRQRSFSVNVPVEGDTTKIQDALLSLPWTPDINHGESRTVRLPKPLTEMDDIDMFALVRGIPQARAEMEAKALEKVKREEAERAALFVRLTMFAKGDPAVDPKGFTPGGFRKVLSKAASKAMDGCDELRAHVNARLELLSEIAEKKEAKETARVKAVREERDRKKEEATAQRAAEIKAWTAEHGSARLQEQLAQGLDGWPLYLHERLQSEFGDDAELDNDGETGTALVNPTDAQLGIARQVAILAVERGLRADVNTAFERIAIVPIEFAIDDEDELVERRVYVTFDGYRPGSEAFKSKTIRFLADDTVRVRLSRHCEES